MTKDDPDIKLTFDKNGAYTTTVQKFYENVKSIQILQWQILKTTY